MALIDRLRARALELGAFRAEIVSAAEISMDASFRKLCESNSCGNYGRNYTCPPDAGAIEDLMAEIRTFDQGLVYQTVGTLEDSYDFEGMMEAGNLHNQLAQKLWDITEADGCMDALHLGAGGCRLCAICAKRTNEPCRNPKRAMASLETYGINVSMLAQQAGMKYINGQNTVTYFGAVLLRDVPEEGENNQ